VYHLLVFTSKIKFSKANLPGGECRCQEQKLREEQASLAIFSIDEPYWFRIIQNKVQQQPVPVIFWL